MAVGQTIIDKTGVDVMSIKLLPVVKNLSIPALFVVAKEDKVTPLPKVRSLFEAYRGRKKEFRVVSGFHHTYRTDSEINEIVNYFKNLNKTISEKPQFYGIETAPSSLIVASALTQQRSQLRAPPINPGKEYNSKIHLSRNKGAKNHHRQYSLHSRGHETSRNRGMNRYNSQPNGVEAGAPGFSTSRLGRRRRSDYNVGSNKSEIFHHKSPLMTSRHHMNYSGHHHQNQQPPPPQPVSSQRSRQNQQKNPPKPSQPHMHYTPNPHHQNSPHGDEEGDHHIPLPSKIKESFKTPLILNQQFSKSRNGGLKPLALGGFSRSRNRQRWVDSTNFEYGFDPSQSQHNQGMIMTESEVLYSDHDAAKKKNNLSVGLESFEQGGEFAGLLQFDYPAKFRRKGRREREKRKADRLTLSRKRKVSGSKENDGPGGVAERFGRPGLKKQNFRAFG